MNIAFTILILLFDVRAIVRMERDFDLVDLFPMVCDTWEGPLEPLAATCN